MLSRRMPSITKSYSIGQSFQLSKMLPVSADNYTSSYLFVKIQPAKKIPSGSRAGAFAEGCRFSVRQQPGRLNCPADSYAFSGLAGHYRLSARVGAPARIGEIQFPDFKSIVYSPEISVNAINNLRIAKYNFKQPTLAKPPPAQPGAAVCRKSPA